MKSGASECWLCILRVQKLDISPSVSVSGFSQDLGCILINGLITYV